MLDKEGVSLWKQISDALVDDIDGGRYRSGDQLPTDVDIAERFGVNRHTARRAIAHLQDEGLLRVEQGRGTFVVENVLEYRLGVHTRFTENLMANHRAPERQVLSIDTMAVPDVARAHLDARPDARCVRLRLVGQADKTPLNIGINYFPLSRVPHMEAALSGQLEADPAKLSITRALRECGVDAYTRKWTKIGARAPSHDEAHLLRLAKSQPILETESLDIDAAGRPVTFAISLYRADRLQFMVEN